MLRSTGKNSVYVDEDIYTERYRRRLWALVAEQWPCLRLLRSNYEFTALS